MSKEHHKVNAGILVSISCDEEETDSLRPKISKKFELNPQYDTIGWNIAGSNGRPDVQLLSRFT